MYFVVFGNDKKAMVDTRKQVRPSHRDYLRKHNHPVKVVLGGPLLDQHAQDMNGTLLVVEAAELQQVEAFLKEDPYSIAGLFQNVEIRPWSWGLGKPEDVVNETVA